MTASTTKTRSATFSEVSTKVDFPKMERDLLDWWYSAGIVEQYLHRNDGSEDRFSFIDGPITANGRADKAAKPEAKGLGKLAARRKSGVGRYCPAARRSANHWRSIAAVQPVKP